MTVKILLSSALLLRHLGLHQHAGKIETAVKQVIADHQVLTADIGGSSTTKEFTKAVIDKVKA